MRHASLAKGVLSRELNDRAMVVALFEIEMKLRLKFPFTIRMVMFCRKRDCRIGHRLPSLPVAGYWQLNLVAEVCTVKF